MEGPMRGSWITVVSLAALVQLGGSGCNTSTEPAIAPVDVPAVGDSAGTAADANQSSAPVSQTPVQPGGSAGTPSDLALPSRPAGLSNPLGNAPSVPASANGLAVPPPDEPAVNQVGPIVRSPHLLSCR